MGAQETAGVDRGLRPRVLVVDDDEGMLRAVASILRRAGCEVVTIADAVEGLAAATEPGLDVVVLDIRMPHLSGLDILRETKAKRPELEVVMMTAHATVDTALEAVKAGAYHYLTKPFENIDDVVLTVRKAAERKWLLERNRTLEGMLVVKERFEDFIGQSGKMQAVFQLIESVSASNATVLVQGESGTGKELVARAIHRRSARKDRPFVAVNCSALSETLLESELFGHVKGSFTGAIANRKGLFEAADAGTVFLDEIGDVPPATQVRLLRVLQEGEIKRVGAQDVTRVDVRVIAASNVDLERATRAGKFRDDLFYRLNVISIHLPPLRERPEDIPLLTHHFLRHHGTRAGKKLEGISNEALLALGSYRWPGNVRELEHAIERAVVLAQGTMVELRDLPPRVLTQQAAPAIDPAALSHLPYREARQLALRAFERRYVAGLLQKAGGNVSSAARAAGMDRSNFRRLMRFSGVDRPDAEEGFELQGSGEAGAAAAGEPGLEASNEQD